MGEVVFMAMHPSCKEGLGSGWLQFAFEIFESGYKWHFPVFCECRWVVLG
jgi:hypothetical protein